MKDHLYVAWASAWRYFQRPTLFLGLALILSACSGGGGGGGGAVLVAPTVTVAPVNMSAINGAAPVVLKFSTSMNPGSLVLGGSMVSGSDGGTWSDGGSINDTLTLNPVGVWTNGIQTLTVDVSDNNGKSLQPVSLTYTVDSTLPAVSIFPVPGSRISVDQAVVVTFSGSANTSTLAASGGMWMSGDAGTWSSSVVVNDTLTIGPAASWPTGAISLTLDVEDLGGIAFATVVIDYTVDGTAPTGVPVPVSGGNLFGDEDIVIKFDESIDVDSLVYGGSLMAQIGSSVWSTDTASNDTTTISPNTTWLTGAGTLDVTVADLAGNGATLNLSYAVTAVVDNDGDGVSSSSDCDDSDARRYPGNVEICDGVDNDCDGVVPANELDGDGDGIYICSGDCDDADANRFPGNTEVCDGIDNNCDTQIDEGCGCVDGNSQSCYTGPAVTLGQGICSAGTQTCSGGVWGACLGEATPQLENCYDLIDNDCDGDVDTADSECPGYCGDGFVDIASGEECDDGNAIDTDACLTSCQFNICGDGVVNVLAEACDDGNTDNYDGCTNNCQAGFPDGGSCTGNSDCLNGYCNSSNVCGPEACATNGTACIAGSECCSGSCEVASGTCQFP